MTRVAGDAKVQYFKIGAVEFLASGKVYSYKAGTYEEKDTYPTIDDANNSTNANANPVVLDSRGEATIVVKGPTKLVLKDADDNLIWTFNDFDNINADILDANSNELISFATVPDAVNNLNITNAATGNNPILSTTGSDTNIGMDLRCRGTGDITVASGDVNITSGDINVTAGNTTITAGDMILTSGNVDFGNGNLIVTDATANFPLLPAGVVTWYGGTTVPTGWLECDGAAVSRTTYSTLFTAIGTTYGVGDGSTTFNLPNQARRVLVGKGGSGTGTLGNAVGDTGGEETHTLTTDEIPAHTHSYDAFDTNVVQQRGSGSGSANNPAGASNSNTQTSDAAGSGTAHNVLQPSLVSMMIIRAY